MSVRLYGGDASQPLSLSLSLSYRVRVLRFWKIMEQISPASG